MATSIESLTPEQLRSLLNGPAVPPPAGTVANLESPPNIDTVCYLTFCLCVSCASLAVMMRLYTKRFLIHSVAYEDYASVIGLIGIWGLFIPSLFAQRSGAGAHAWDLRLSAFSRTIYWFDIAVFVYVAEVFFVKLSILQYLRIFVPERQANWVMFLATHICIWSIFSFSVIYLFLNIFMCDPRDKLWDPLVNTGHCYNSNTNSESSGIFNVVSDFAILILPMPCLWKLQMPVRQKIFMMGVFATGFLACVTSVVRTYYSFQVPKSTDRTYNLELMGLWGWAEITIGIIVGCLPVLPKFIRHIGVKVSTTFSFRSKDGVSTAHGLKVIDKTPKANVMTKIQRPKACKYLADLYTPQARLPTEYITHGKDDSPSFDTIMVHEPNHPPSAAIATRRDDLEYGQS